MAELDSKNVAQQYRGAEEKVQANAAGNLAEGGADTTKPTVPTEGDLTALLAKVDKGKPKPEDLEAVRVALRAGGRAVSALDTPAQVTSLLNSVNTTPGVRAVMDHEVQRVRDQLGYSASSALERLLIEHCALCWLRLYLAETTLTQVTSQSHTLTEGRYREQRLTEAQGRYLRALGLLARLRRLGPAVQVNIAEQMIVQNTGETTTGAE